MRCVLATAAMTRFCHRFTIGQRGYDYRREHSDMGLVGQPISMEVLLYAVLLFKTTAREKSQFKTGP
jgi:hypothetical protein